MVDMVIADLELNIMEDTLNAVLLFHTHCTWTQAHRNEWKRITGTDEATADVLCEHIRKVVGYFEVRTYAQDYKDPWNQAARYR